MRPRQNLRDYHHNSHPPYQSMNHNPNLLQQRQQSMMPPHPPSGTPPLLGTTSGNAASRVIQPPLPTPDLISELVKLGFNPEDMAKQSNRPEDLLRNLQAFLSKREAADLLQKLPLNELFMQSTSEFARSTTLGVGAGSRDNVICGPSGVSGPPSGPTSFINNINNGNANKQEQDTHYPNHQANHHQQFRIPATNSTTVHNSPQQQHKQSVLSIHHQQQQQHQDPANRRMNDQQHMMTNAPGSSYGNLNDMSGRTIPTSSSLESHSSNIFNRRKPSPPVNSYTTPSASLAPRALNLVDTLGTSSGSGHPGQLDNNMYDNPAFQKHNVSSTNQQQSLIRHQQLQKLLRSAANGPPKTNMPLPTSNLSSRHDPHSSSQRTSISNLAQMQRQMTSPNTSSAISPPQQALSSVPKSLLNLAACTSKSPPVTNNVASIGKSHRTFQPNYSTNAASNCANNPIPNNKGATPRQGGNGNSAFNNRTQNSVDPTNILHQMISRSNQAKSSNQGLNRNSQNTNALTSLLSDERKTTRPNTGQPNSHHPSNVTKSSNQTPIKRQPQSTSDSNAVHEDLKSKEAYLAYLQERAAKAGVSIGEIGQGPARQDSLPQHESQSPEISASSARYSSATSSNPKDNDPRNDLSLLYPPIELATSSQRQVSLLAAGLNLSEGVDVITDEVRKIIQQECNIIYECKGCSNLFRSLANLVKHKRQFCDNSNLERAYSELNKQFLNNVASSDLPNPSKPPIAVDHSKNRSTTSGDNRDSSIFDSRRVEHLNASVSIGSQKYNLRGRRIDPNPDISTQVKSARMTRSHDYKERISSADAQLNSDKNISSHQTNLSRLLQSQPKSMQPTAKESALMDALNMPNPVSNRRSVINNPRNCSVNEINEQLVKNSSLAKTLLNENAKSMNSSGPSMQLARAVAQQPKIGPKKKLLEDCIQKVKRDKMCSGEEDDPEDSRDTRCGQQDRRKFDDINQFKDPLAIEDSEADSDVLVMDLDEPVNTSRSKRKGLRDPKPEDDRNYDSGQTNRPNTSSALLKALTRPVESKSVGNKKSSVDKAPTVLDRSSETQDASSTEVRSTSTRQNEREIFEDSGSSIAAVEGDLEVAPPSPLFDKYTCEMCESDLDDQLSLLAHIMEEHKKESKIYPCLFCSFTFITLENVCRHIIDIHRKTKTQVGHLKEVVRSRSFISQDFMTCSDCPPALPNTGDEKTHHEEVPNIVLTGKTSPDVIQTRRSSSALSDSAATKQILEDTLALVSDSASPDAANRYNPTDRLAQIISRSRPSDKPSESLPTQENKVSEQSDTIADDNEDPLCDSLMNNLTEHLAILESQEAEIEEEKQRRQKVVATLANGENLDEDYIQAEVGPPKVKHESPNDVELALCDTEASQINVESRNQQTTPSRGKHIVAGQPFHTEETHNTDQDDEGDCDDDDLDFAEQESHGAMPEDNSAYDEDIEEPEDVESDDSDYNQDHEESDEGESFSAEFTESVDNEGQDCHDESSEQHQKGLGIRTSSRVSSRRVHKRRRSSRNDDDDDDIEANERRLKSDTDLSPSFASDKSETQNFHDVALEKDGSSHSLDTTSKASTIEGGCKLKLKTSALRDVCGGVSSSSGGHQGGSSADSSGGGIKKLKIQLKAQPDEKSKVYRIVN